MFQGDLKIFQPTKHCSGQAAEFGVHGDCIAMKCDRHGHELAGESPAIALERRECVDKGKGA